MTHYMAILDSIKLSGAEVLSEVFVHDALNYGGSPLPADQIYRRDTEMIKAADLVIAEVTNPSLGVGYELAYAEKLKKQILCLFDRNSSNILSAMVEGNSYNNVEYYDSESLTKSITNFIMSSIPAK